MTDIAKLHDVYLNVMSTSARSRHIPALELFRAKVAEQAGEVEAHKAVERLLNDYHHREAARQFAEAREELSFTRAPDASLPPALSLHQIGSLIHQGDNYVSAYQVLDQVAGSYRYRMKLRRLTQNDLLRWSTLFGGRVLHDVYDNRPVPIFDRLLVMSWLAAGGRAWIIGELDRLGERRVIPFTGRRA